MVDPASNVWRQCSSCKKDLFFGQAFHECSVSTCTRTRIPLSFCGVACWDAHLPSARHREAWAVEARAPSRAEWARTQTPEPARAMPTPARVTQEPGRAMPTSARVTTAPPGSRPSVPVVARTSSGPDAPTPIVWSEKFSKDVLVVVSKLKQYIRDRSTMNTSDGVVDVLSEHLRSVCDEAIRNAAEDGRKTVMDRDVKPVTARWRLVR